jgi:hypothetical protein
VFCVHCGNLIQRSDERVRVDDLLLHAGCVISYLLSKFPGLKANS